MGYATPLQSERFVNTTPPPLDVPFLHFASASIGAVTFDFYQG
jgi:hypothetical protein